MKRLLPQLRWPLVRPRGWAPGAEPVAGSSDPRLRHQAALVYLSRRALRTPASGSILGDICRIAARVLQADHVHVLELLPDRRTVIARAAAGWAPERLARWQIDVPADSRVAQAMRTGGLIVLDRGTEPASGPGGGDLLHEVRMHCGLAAGVSPGPDAFSLFGVYSAKPRRFTREDLQFVRGVAQLVESALQREAERNSGLARRVTTGAAQADLLRIIVGRLRPALRESVAQLWHFRTQPTDTFSFRRAVRQTERQVAGVTDFIEDLSLLADLLDDHNPSRASVLLAPVLASLLDQLSERAASNNICLQLRMADELVATSGDAPLLRRALFNLIDNALRFTGPGGTVTITVASDDPATALIEIADTGRGMTAAQIERLLQNKEGAVRSEHRGPSLGWRLACAIIEAHGGALGAASAGPDQGSTISVRVPRLHLGDRDVPSSAD